MPEQALSYPVSLIYGALLCSHLPMHGCSINTVCFSDLPTDEFRVLVFPTKHTEQLRLQGEYVLRVTNNEVALYSGSAGLPTIFQCPLNEVLRTQHSAFGNQNPGHGLYSSFIDQNLTVTCLAVHTGR